MNTKTEQLNLIRTNILLSKEFKKWRNQITKTLKQQYNDRLIQNARDLF
jgi:hypothetical protein